MNRASSAFLMLGLVLGGVAAGAQSDGVARLTLTLTQEQGLTAFSTLITNTFGTDSGQQVQCRYWRRRAADGSVQVLVAFLPSSQRDNQDPAAAIKLFSFTGGRCTFTFRGRSIAVDPALVPTYGISDFIIPPALGQLIAVSAATFQGLPCTHLTQTIPADPATQVGAIVMDYDIDEFSGLIVHVVRHDGAAQSYSVVRSALKSEPDAASAAVFALPQTLRPGLISDPAALHDAFVHGIP